MGLSTTQSRWEVKNIRGTLSVGAAFRQSCSSLPTVHRPMSARRSPAHAPSLPREGPQGATGTRAPHGQPGGRLTSGPGRLREASLRAAAPLPGTLRGPLGRLAAPALAAISVPVRSSASRPAPAKAGVWRCHTAIWQPTVSRHRWRFPVSGLPGPPGSRASVQALPSRRRPPAREKDGCIHVPSQQAAPSLSHAPGGAG